jgi:hypothetical protein
MNGDVPIPAQPPPAAVAARVDTVDSYATKWLEFIPLTKKVSTVGFYRDHLKNHVVPALGSVGLAALTRSECKKFALSLRGKKLARASMVGILATLSALLGRRTSPSGVTASTIDRRYLQPTVPIRQLKENVRLGPQQELSATHTYISKRSGRSRRSLWASPEWRAYRAAMRH